MKSVRKPYQVRTGYVLGTNIRTRYEIGTKTVPGTYQVRTGYALGTKIRTRYEIGTKTVPGTKIRTRFEISTKTVPGFENWPVTHWLPLFSDPRDLGGGHKKSRRLYRAPTIARRLYMCIK